LFFLVVAAELCDYDFHKRCEFRQCAAGIVARFDSRPGCLYCVFWAKTTSFGQGIVDFENFNNSQISTSGPTTGLISGPAGTYYFALLVAPTSQTSITPSLSGWGFEDYGYNTTTPGLMNGNYTTDPGVLVGFYGPGEQANFAVLGWSANIGTSYGAATAWVEQR